MRRLGPIRLWSVLIILACLSCQKDTKSPPNFIFILVDDLGWRDLGCYGSTFYETENIDRLAEEGVLFTNAYAASPVCSPTRAAIMTGKYPSRVDITDWIPGLDPKDRKLLGPQDQDQLALEETTIAEYLKRNGYNTFFGGKWHLGSEGFFPEDQGFDINMGGHEKGSPPGGYYTPYKNPKLSDGPEGEYLTDRLTDESIKFLQENGDDPFFLFLSFYTVHTPIQANKEHVGKFETKLKGMSDNTVRKLPEHDGSTVRNQVNADYASMVYSLDLNIGRLMDELEQMGLRENTVVIFTSDNGGLSTLPENWNPPTTVLPLRAGKGWCYEGGIRVPLIINGPGIQKSTKNDVPVISMDFYPTILELAGLPELPDQHLDGLNITPLLTGQNKIGRSTLFWHFPHYHGSTWTPGSAVRMGDWKLIRFYDKEKTELFNLKEDMGERNDLSATHPNMVKDLEAKLDSLLFDTGSKFPVVNEPGSD